jgi:signal transduction histidine kinase
LIINEFNTLGVARVEFEATGSDKRLPDETELALFRITQEALNNIRKHSKASSARVTLEYTESRLRLKITDNGIGFADFKKSSFDKKSGLGLLGMRERAQLVSATLTIDSTLGSGTTVCVEVPCV